MKTNPVRIGILIALLCSVAMAQPHVMQRLEESPRHHEWVNVANGDRTVRCFLTYPEASGEATGVLVIHENRGLTDWVRGVTDQLAAQGYVAIAPDLLSGAGPGGGGTDSFPSQDAAREGIYGLDPDQVTSDLQAVADHLKRLPGCSGQLTVAGFCWGGGQSFRFATDRQDLQAACVFYGRFDPTEEELARIRCPVFGFYGENDARITSTVNATAASMEAADRIFEPVTYDGAGHGFMRAGEGPDASEPNRRAREQGWTRWLAILGSI